MLDVPVKESYVPKCQIARRYREISNSSSVELANFKTNMPMTAFDPKEDAPDLDWLPRLERWSPTGPRSLMTSP